MTARRLLWELVKHVLTGRGGDIVFVDIDDLDDGSIVGLAQGFAWVDRREAFCVIQAAECTP